MINWLLALMFAVVTADQPQSPNMATVFIVDVSGSMSGPRLETAKTELRELIEQAPPGKDHVVVLVPFNSIASAPQYFTTEQAALAAINGLQASGGTNIANGLHGGRTAASRLLNARNLLILFYSDGEDPDQAAVLKEEEKLSALFSDRHAKSLSNHVSLKRWGNANAPLRARLLNNPHVDVTDAGELQIRPLGIHPGIRVSSARRSDQNPRELVIDFQAAVSVQMKRAGEVGITVQAVCKNPGASGDVQLSLRSNFKAANHRVVVPLSLQDEKRGVVDLVYQVTPPKNASTVEGSILLPLMNTSTLKVPIRIPAGTISVFVESELTVKGATRWEDPVSGRAVVEADLKVTRHDKDYRADQQRPITAVLKPRSGCQLISGPSELKIPKPGGQTYQLEFSVPKRAGSEPPVFDLAVDVFSQSDTPLLKVQPPSHSWMQRDIAAPPPVVVPLTLSAKAISKPKWLLLPDLCLFQLQARVVVDGPIPPNTSLVLTAPAQVAKLQIRPGELRSGEQTISLVIWATLPPAPDRTPLQFNVTAVSPSPHQIRLECKQPLTFSQVGPEPVRVVNAIAQQAVTVADNATTAVVPVSPVLEGIGDPRVANRLGCDVGWQRGGAGSKSVPLYSHDQLLIPLKEEQQSFFRSTEFALPVTFGPGSTTTAVQPTRSHYRIIKRPPFIRIFLYLCVAIGPTSVGVLVFWLFRRFRAVEQAFPAGNGHTRAG